MSKGYFTRIGYHFKVTRQYASLPLPFLIIGPCAPIITMTWAATASGADDAFDALYLSLPLRGHAIFGAGHDCRRETTCASADKYASFHARVIESDGNTRHFAT